MQLHWQNHPPFLENLVTLWLVFVIVGDPSTPPQPKPQSSPPPLVEAGHRQQSEKSKF